MKRDPEIACRCQECHIEEYCSRFTGMKRDHKMVRCWSDVAVTCENFEPFNPLSICHPRRLGILRRRLLSIIYLLSV